MISPLILLAAAGGAWLLLSKPKAQQAQQTKPSTVTVTLPNVTPQPSAPAQPSTTVQIPATPATPAVDVQVPVGMPAPPNIIAATNSSPTLTYEEQVSIESDLPDYLYNKAMASQHPAYVAAAAARLAAAGDTRAMDLTLRVANWGS
jgi:hypothetical protein